MTTKEAVDHLSKELRHDPGYWYSWKANIAVQFEDVFSREHRHKGVHEIANMAAQSFLELLTKEEG